MLVCIDCCDYLWNQNDKFGVENFFVIKYLASWYDLDFDLLFLLFLIQEIG